MSQSPPDLPPDSSVPYESPLPADPRSKFDWAAITALVVGCVNVLSWCLPVCGCPIGIAGIIFGVVGLKSTKRGMAMAGLIMSIISMVLTVINAVIGLYMQQNHKGIWGP